MEADITSPFLPTHSHVGRLMLNTELRAAMLSIPLKLAQHLRTAFNPHTDLWLTVSQRAYLMGQRVMSTPAKALGPEMYSLLASPSFHNSAQFSKVLFRQDTPVGTLYRIGEVLIMFTTSDSCPRVKRGEKAKAEAAAAAAAAAADPSLRPVKYALVQLYDRVMPTLRLGAAPGDMSSQLNDFGALLKSWKPSEDELLLPTGCVRLEKTPGYTMVIPLSWVVQTVHVVPHKGTPYPNRYLLNKWFWRLPKQK